MDRKSNVEVSPPPVPRWVWAIAIVAGAILLMAVVAAATGLGGQHGPGRHIAPVGDAGGAPATPALEASGDAGAGGHVPPMEAHQ